MTERTLLFGLNETGLDQYRSETERTFLEALHRRAEAAGWYGDAWPLDQCLAVSVTLKDPTCSAVRRTLRIDFNGTTVLVGDDSTHQLVENLDPSMPDVLELSSSSVSDLAGLAADWIERELLADDAETAGQQGDGD